jgi:uncharacterized protein YjiS (DUF1127 family)
MNTLANPFAAPFAAAFAAAARGHAQARAGALLQRSWNALRSGLELLSRRHRLARMQATLAALDEATLRDVGLRRADAAAYWAQAEGLQPQRHPMVVRRGAWDGYRPYHRPIAP